MTRQEYNESVGIKRMIDAGNLDKEVDDEWIEFIDLILHTIPNKKEQNDDRRGD